MQTNLSGDAKTTEGHIELDKILRSCVHCGFCNATCPTYQLTGDELDGPRGRIYLLKQMLEGSTVGKTTQHHIDRCLTCRSCESTCPSGVEYSRLLDLSRPMLEQKVPRTFIDKIKRRAMLSIFPYRFRFQKLIQLARLFKPFLPEIVRQKIPAKSITQEWPQAQYSRKVLLLQGCVQPTLAPAIDYAAARVLDKLGISLLPVKSTGCCGALNQHLSDPQRAKILAQKNIDACWPYIEQGAECITITASGCGVTLKEYETLLKYDANYREKAKQFSAKVKDLSEIISAEDLSVLNSKTSRVAYQSPCTLQHGQQITGVVESILRNIGFELTQVDNAHLCCGSAGVYSLLQPQLSEQLSDNKLTDLHTNQTDCIATANIGCLTHLQTNASVKVVHWITLLD